ncbi:MAG: anthranilate phosphoribosyltransferase [Candidatus Raymondbacteria bacterium RifOxyA12_full_50_37]|uniref:Anthranilate phosphoribosyltransferase n=1 Tax=Candidatus Raymondbacteria bacterium RIFOXYD12_FULL_49_13 TaxID=1817890 RepID=A0A1F7F5Q3_UNCRA|nr:MAG: anthranilate phosphoribosyltransferase [Candidatus Raymondbacteria bacterium RifOxyA12_full_50_37]OGJ89175.1 MAG: anthranilate phosphoribosyltransferase [Candidatus Raymondbacteria bacterium RIFOXYA2_FULL_49_16]OGJ96657.1 MAG: anthranilate phosphoribosyltransferase [Candidatus Raymondbacteria bacterium RIFOXYC2_FULL_50_21]OGJ99998.1 MAG: anthranilate phosphoribosyltransferase [Candidatus Raymondbacteria bacterium RifOxyB12_full_50_8]OGK01969.1 MAG: anthranilate phosphoribosyltransferase
MIQQAIQTLVSNRNLTEQEAMEAMRSIMEGKATPVQIAGFVTALRMKGETIEEITGCARVMREKASRISPKVVYCIDTCGTGGDGSQTFNISTAAAFVAAAGGVAVAKHGNRSVSSKSGSADVLEALGIFIGLTPEQVQACIETTGIGFLFAPSFHPSMKYAAGPRKELGIRTIFNILGPLTNPANAQGQLLGVFDRAVAEQMAGVLLNLGVEHALVVHGCDGLDEITLTGPTHVFEVREGNLKGYQITPDDYGMAHASRKDFLGGDSIANSKIIFSVLKGEKGPCRDIVLLNAAAAFYVGKKAGSIKDGIALAESAIDSGKALAKVEELRKMTEGFRG